MNALPIVHVALSSRSDPSRKVNLAVTGLAANAWASAPVLGVLCAYCPASWHHPIGIKRVLQRILPNLPDVSGALFVTLTYDRHLFSSPASAHDKGRAYIRKMMDTLRRGVSYHGKNYEIDAPYLIVWAWTEHKIQAKQAGRQEERQIVIIIDEVEAHLHPKWQRVILPSLLGITADLSEELSMQLIVATHSPMVLASSESIFNNDQDKLFHLQMAEDTCLSINWTPN